MATRFWVGGTGTWDAVTTTHWAASTGGAGGQSVPGSADTVTFDGASGGGTVTVNFGGTITIISLTTGAFTGTLDFSANNNSITLSAVTGWNNNSTGTRSINMGSGTWTFTGVGTTLISTNFTGLTLTSSAANLVFTATTASARAFNITSGTTFASLTVSANTSGGTFQINNAALTITALTITVPNAILFFAGVTTTITNALTITGTSATPDFLGSSTLSSAATVSSANNGTLTWCGIRDLTFAGGGAFTATNSFDLGHNSGITITAPTAGGASGGFIIGD